MTYIKNVQYDLRIASILEGNVIYEKFMCEEQPANYGYFKRSPLEIAADSIKKGFIAQRILSDDLKSSKTMDTYQ